MMRAVAIYAALLLTACAHDEPLIVKEAASVPCLGERPARPIYRFDKLPKPRNASEAAEAAKALYLDFEDADAYGTKWEAAAAGCR